MNVAARLTRFVMSWPHTVRKLVTIVLVFNVALGMAFSVIGLRHQAGDRAAAQGKLLQQMSGVNAIRAEIWKSIDQGSATANLTNADLGAFDRVNFGADVNTGPLHTQTEAFTDIVQAARTDLAAGDVEAARTQGTQLFPGRPPCWRVCSRCPPSTNINPIGPMNWPMSRRCC